MLGERAADAGLAATLTGGGVPRDGAAQRLRRRLRLALCGEDRSASLRGRRRPGPPFHSVVTPSIRSRKARARVFSPAVAQAVAAATW